MYCINTYAGDGENGAVFRAGKLKNLPCCANVEFLDAAIGWPTYQKPDLKGQPKESWIAITWPARICRKMAES